MSNSEKLQDLSAKELENLIASLEDKYQTISQKKLTLDLTRGKPDAEQVGLSNELDGILKGDFISRDGIDTRNYGTLDGLPEVKELVAPLLGVDARDVIVGGNSSLQLMYQVILTACLYGVDENSTPWRDSTEAPKVIFIVPGYDRHFNLALSLGVEPVVVNFNDDGPDMDKVEELVKSDSSIRAIWGVPKYSNPTGHTYSDEVIDRLASLAKIAAAKDFRVILDNAYGVHDFGDNPPKLKDIMPVAIQNSTEDSIILFGSMSKITLAGAAISYMAISENNRKHFLKYYGYSTIGNDKVNQLKHYKFFTENRSISEHMKLHADIVRPKFEKVLTTLERDLGGKGIATWTNPQGGYFISFDSLEGTASEIVRLAGDVGLKLTPAGATYPGKNDEKDSNLRIAPTFANLENVEASAEIFTTCVLLACARKVKS